MENDTPVIEDQTEQNDNAPDPFLLGMQKVLGVEINDDQKQEPTEQSDAESVGHDSDNTQAVQELSQEELRAAIEKVNAFEKLDLAGKVALLDKLKDFDPDKTNQRTEQVFGKLGRIEQIIKELGSSKKTKLSPDNLKRSFKEYPELAEALAEDLSELMLERHVVEQSPIDFSLLESAIEQKIRNSSVETDRALELKFLGMLHKDWQSKVTSTEFESWLNSKPVDYQNNFKTSWKAEDVSTVLTEFDEFKANVNAKKEQKQQRLAAAVTPQSSPKPTVRNTVISDEEAFNMGMRKALQGR